VYTNKRSLSTGFEILAREPPKAARSTEEQQRGGGLSMDM